MIDTLLEMVDVPSMVVVIGTVGGAGDMDGKEGIAGTTGTATVDSSAHGTGGVATLTFPPFLHGRGVFF